jgi:crotonobetainyl-CoA:carnitine CoA-transferase CaiB-like acyl-CoA transferase
VIYPSDTFDCAGEIIMGIVQNPSEWKGLCEGVLHRSNLLMDPRIANNSSRLANRLALDTTIMPLFAVQPKAEMIIRLEGNQLAWANVLTVVDLSSHPAMGQMEVEFSGGVVSRISSPLRRDLTPEAAPALGADMERVRAEFAA